MPRKFVNTEWDIVDEIERNFLSVGQTHMLSVDKKNRTVDAVMSTDTIDSYGEIVEPRAFLERLDRFVGNPVLVANHVYAADDGKSGGIGHWSDFGVKEIDGGRMGFVGRATFMPGEAKDELTENIWNRIKYDVLKTFSVGFGVHAWESRKVQVEGSERNVRVYTDVELFECSAVTIPANPDAHIRQAAAGWSGQRQAQGLDQLLEALGSQLKESIDREFTDLLSPEKPKGAALMQFCHALLNGADGQASARSHQPPDVSEYAGLAELG